VNNVYQLKEDRYFRCGITSFLLPKGAIIKVTQWDATNRKVLVDFGGRLCDWYHISILDEFEIKSNG